MICKAESAHAENVPGHVRILGFTVNFGCYVRPNENIAKNN